MFNIFVAQPEFTQKTFSPLPTYKGKFQFYTTNISTSKTLFESELIVGRLRHEASKLPIIWFSLYF